MTPLERRYRRMLRLLPAGYRQTWEEDMVTTFLQSTDGAATGRPSLAERLSVLTLAIRLRLTGSHASPRRPAWYPAAYPFALMVLLHQAVFASVGLAVIPALIRWRPMEHRIVDIGQWIDAAYFVVWIAALGAAVFGRVVVARILAVVAAAPMALLLFVYVLHSGNLYLGDLAVLAWPVLCAAAAFAIPRGARPSRRLWLGAYVAGSLILAPAAALSYAPRDWVQYVNLPLAWRLALLMGMVVVLATPARRRSPGSLIAFALFTAGLLLNLIGYGPPIPQRTSTAAPPQITHWLDLVLLGLGVTCAIVGVRAMRRRMRAVPGPA